MESKTKDQDAEQPISAEPIDVEGAMILQRICLEQKIKNMMAEERQKRRMKPKCSQALVM